MSVHPFTPTTAADEKPVADLVDMAMQGTPDTMSAAEIERIMNSPAYLFSHEDGVFSVALLFQTFEDHGAALSEDDIEDMFLGLVMDEVKRMLEAECTTSAPVAAARFAGFCKTIGRCLYRSWEAGTYAE